ncbi:MAG: hypothetical protein GC200_02595 [Tepidisphaera sp.]|nr:hypothetical protein [Tepidisphaera sp.]
MRQSPQWFVGGSGSILRSQTDVGRPESRVRPGKSATRQVGGTLMHLSTRGDQHGDPSPTTHSGGEPGGSGSAVRSIEELEHQGQRISQSRPDLLRRVSDAQRKVLDLLIVGCTEPQIAERLGRSKHTVHDHTKAIYAQLGVKSRVHLVLLFSRPPSDSPARND